MLPDKLYTQLEEAAIVAGFSLQKPEDGVPLCRALLAGGVSAIELTLRTPAGLAAIRPIREALPDILLGVGTILSEEQARAVKEAGVDFGVSPGLNPQVVEACQRVGLPFMPGIATPSELEQAIALGCTDVKLFPAEALGGLPYLRSMGAPYCHLGIRYFPLGGIHGGNLSDYLSEPNVFAVGGSWIVKQELIATGDWQAITERARGACDACRALEACNL